MTFVSSIDLSIPTQVLFIYAVLAIYFPRHRSVCLTVVTFCVPHYRDCDDRRLQPIIQLSPSVHDWCLMCTQIISFVFCFNPGNFIAFHLMFGYGLYEMRKVHVAIDADTICNHVQDNTLEPASCYQCL